MKLVVIGGSSDGSGEISGFLNRLGQSGISHRMIIYTSNWKTSLEVIELHSDTDLVVMPPNPPIDFLKQLKRLARSTPFIFQDDKTGDFRLINLRNDNERVRFHADDLHPRQQTITKLVRSLNHQSAPADRSPELVAAKNRRRRFLVRIASRLRPVAVEEIAYFHADNRLNYLTTWQGQQYLINQSMEQLVGLLHGDDFFRISRSFIVSYKSITMIQVQERNRLKLTLTPTFKTDLFVSREKVAAFRSWLED